jgi:hypothetical protein
MDEIGFVTWKIVQWVLWAGPLGVGAFLLLLAVASFCAGCGMMAMRRKPKEIAMGHGVPMHGKTDILPDGTNTPVDIFN